MYDDAYMINYWGVVVAGYGYGTVHKWAGATMPITFFKVSYQFLIYGRGYGERYYDTIFHTFLDFILESDATLIYTE